MQKVTFYRECAMPLFCQTKNYFFAYKKGTVLEIMQFCGKFPGPSLKSSDLFLNDSQNIYATPGDKRLFATESHPLN